MGKQERRTMRSHVNRLEKEQTRIQDLMVNFKTDPKIRVSQQKYADELAADISGLNKAIEADLEKDRRERRSGFASATT